MQKIQFYLVPNKITVTTDRVGFNTEYRQVYQRQLKIYKGIDNTIQLDVRNSEQRKQTVVGQTAVVKFFDAKQKNLFTATATAIPSQLGQMTLTIDKDTVANLDPQMLRMAAYLTDGVTDSPIYIDGQFELFGNVLLADGYNDAPDFTDEITVFNYEFDKMAYVSEMAQFGVKINEDYSTAPVKSTTIEVYPNTGFNGEIQVFVTNDKSTASSVTWTNIDTLTVDASTHIPATNTFVVTGEYRYIRFSYNKYIAVGSETLTGTLDKIILRN